MRTSKSLEGGTILWWNPPKSYISSVCAEDTHRYVRRDGDGEQMRSRKSASSSNVREKNAVSFRRPIRDGAHCSRAMADNEQLTCGKPTAGNQLKEARANRSNKKANINLYIRSCWLRISSRGVSFLHIASRSGNVFTAGDRPKTFV